MADISEINLGQTWRAATAMLALRPRWQSSDALVDFIDNRLRPSGYRLTGVFEEHHDTAVSVIGFRESWSSAWGHHLYVDDLSTIPDARGHGHADTLMRWVVAEAQRLNCEAIHLDSGVGATRAAAHRLYMRNNFAITAHHFDRRIMP